MPEAGARRTVCSVNITCVVIGEKKGEVESVQRPHGVKPQGQESLQEKETIIRSSSRDAAGPPKTSVILFKETKDWRR